MFKLLLYGDCVSLYPSTSSSLMRALIPPDTPPAYLRLAEICENVNETHKILEHADFDIMLCAVQCLQQQIQNGDKNSDNISNNISNNNKSNNNITQKVNSLFGMESVVDQVRILTEISTRSTEEKIQVADTLARYIRIFNNTSQCYTIERNIIICMSPIFQQPFCCFMQNFSGISLLLDTLLGCHVPGRSCPCFAAHHVFVALLSHA